MVCYTGLMKTVTVFTKEDFRKWLKVHHKKETKVGVVVYKKHTGKPFPTHRELIDEAICYGWIDTTIRRIDDDTFMRSFSKRNKNSTWSDNTLGYARELIKQKRMRAEGMKYYEFGRKKPTHDDGIPKNPSMPAELKKEIAKSKKISAVVNGYSPSKKKMYYRWILSGKRPETRTKRAKAIYEAAKKGEHIF